MIFVVTGPPAGGKSTYVETKKGVRDVRTKSCKASVEKSATALDRGEVTMLVSVFGNVDSYGDEVMPGAFAESLKKWEASGNPIPFIWSHDWGNPEAHIGAITSAKETETGLEVTAKIDLDRPFAAQVFRLLKERRVTQASFAFDVLESEWVEREALDGAKYEVYELRKLDLLEAGPCLIGVNRETELLDAKAREVVQRVLTELSEGRKSPPNQSGTQPEVDTELTAKSAQSRARLTLTALEGI